MFEISRNALTVFGFDVHWYGLLIALGVMAAVLLAGSREERLGLERDTGLNIALVCMPVAIVCARLYYVLFSWEYYAAHPADILNIRQGGLAVYGGVIGGVLAGFVYARIRKISFSRGLDLAAPSIALGQAIGRWGNFFNQEAYGAAVENPALHFFPMAVQIDGKWHYAAFFYESLWCLLIVAFILIAERRRFFRRSGDIFAAYVFLYGIERALVEGLRTDSLLIGPIRVSQLLSLLAVLAVCLLLARRQREKPAFLRLMPVTAVILLGAALSFGSIALAMIPALAVIGLSAVVYNRK